MQKLELPIDGVLPDIHAALRQRRRLVLAAPPGAGKTTRVPLALAGFLAGFEPYPGKIIVLEPRRIAARMAAERMAASLKQRLGETIGLTTRIEKRTSAKTQVEVVTEGVFVRRLITDPELHGVSAVLFDEIHERSLNSDLALALTRDVQSALREDLHILAMSATLDAELLAERLGAVTVESKGRAWPVETKYLGRTRDPLPGQVVKAIDRAARETEGSILVFLPGAADIRRVAERLDLGPSFHVAPLYGALSPNEQDAAILPPKSGIRKVVLATDIAESSLTIEGVTVVIDTGLARVPVYDPNGRGTGLQTVRAARANVDQRRGRAGRTGPGVCYRLWDEAETRGLNAAPEPEISRADLSGLVLTLAEWGEYDPNNLNWLTPPPEGRVQAARQALSELGALDSAQRLTDKGKAMTRLPLAPDLAALIIGMEDPSEKALAAQIAALLSERGIGGRSPDLAQRLKSFQADTSPRAQTLRKQAARWASAPRPSGDPAEILAKGWPMQIAKRRLPSSATYLLASGRAGHVDEAQSLAQSEWLVVAEMIGAAKGARITLAAPISAAMAQRYGQITTESHAVFDPNKQSFQARRVTYLGAIKISEQPLPKPTPAAAKAAYIAHLQEAGFVPTGVDGVIARYCARVYHLRAHLGADWPIETPETLQASVGSWLGEILADNQFAIPNAGRIEDALTARLGWALQGDLAKFAPLRWSLPTGRSVAIDWCDERAPLIECKPQELYGETNHPAVARGRLPLTVQFLSPGGKPIATTRDLGPFWSTGYRDLAKDMRGRYPKHDWPDDPASALSHAGLTKARLAKGAH